MEDFQITDPKESFIRTAACMFAQAFIQRGDKEIDEKKCVDIAFQLNEELDRRFSKVKSN